MPLRFPRCSLTRGRNDAVIDHYLTITWPHLDLAFAATPPARGSNDHLTNIWPLFGQFDHYLTLGNLFDHYLTAPCRSPSAAAPPARGTRWSPQTSSWATLRILTITWPIFDQYLTIIWPSLDGHLTAYWTEWMGRVRLPSRPGPVDMAGPHGPADIKWYI
jgi:hypothetical protein